MIRAIERVAKEPEVYIKEKPFWHRLWNLAPDMENKEGMIMYKDPHETYAKTLLGDLEWDFLMLDVCVISFLVRAVPEDSRVVSPIMMGVLVAYILDQFLIYFRKSFGTRNLAKHTLADERFLM
jgi:hypothetical protein